MQAFHNTLPSHKTWIFHRQFVEHLKYRAITIAVLEVDSQLVSTGVSRCSKADNFCKKKGRAIATGRAEKSCKKISCCFGFFGVNTWPSLMVGGLHSAKHVADRITAECLFRGK